MLAPEDGALPAIPWLLAALMLSTAMAASSALGTGGSDGSDTDHEVHRPITIDDASDLEQPEEISGVVGGSGTAGDPYVIEGWRIAPEFPRVPPPTGSPLLTPDPGVDRFECELYDHAWDQLGDPSGPKDPGGVPTGEADDELEREADLCHAAITIRNTDVHIVVRDNVIVPREGLFSEIPREAYPRSSWGMPGVVVEDAAHVRISQNRIGEDLDPPDLSAKATPPDRLGRGVTLQNVEDVRVEGNTIQHVGDQGILVDDSTDVVLAGNRIHDIVGLDSPDVAQGILAVGVTGLLVEGNNVTASAKRGILTVNAPDVRILRNTVVGNHHLAEDAGTGAIHVSFGSDPDRGRANVSENLILDNGDGHAVYFHDTKGTLWRNAIDDLDHGPDAPMQQGVRMDKHHIDATENWWGCPTGPSHPDHNEGDPDCQPVTRWDPNHPHHPYLETEPDVGAG